MKSFFSLTNLLMVTIVVGCISLLLFSDRGLINLWSLKKEKLEETNQTKEERNTHLDHKKNELDAIMKETEKEEAELLKKSDEFQSKIDESLLRSYLKIRSSVKNGLAVVPVERGASAGSFFVIPPQVQLDIASRKKFITDEHSGRILVDKELANEENEKMEKIFTSI